MKRALVTLVALILVIVPASVVLASPDWFEDWFENWDSYPTGQSMHGVNGWKGWDNDPTWTAYTSSVQSFSAPNSIEIAGASDLVHEFSGYDDRVWRFTAQQFVPNEFTGWSYFILLNQYADLGPYSWAAQVWFDGFIIVDDFYGGALPLIKGQWVEIYVEIDLKTDWQKFYYGGDLLYEGPWPGGSDITLDLFAFGSSPVYYDDLKIEISNDPPVADADGPYSGSVGSSITFNGSASYDPDDDITLYEWDFDGDGQYDDASGEIVQWSWGSPYSGSIGLNVTDTFGAWDTDEARVDVTLAPIPPPVEVGGEVYPLNKVSVLAPWIALSAAIIAGAIIAIKRRRARC